MGVAPSSMSEPFMEFSKCKPKHHCVNIPISVSPLLHIHNVLGTKEEAGRIVREFREREYDFALDDKRIRLLLCAKSKKKRELSQLILDKFSRNGKM